MQYISTRGGVEPIDFSQAVLMGLADDGGLLIPESIPDCSDRLSDWADLPYPALAYEVMRLFNTSLPEADLRAMIDAAYGEPFGPEVAPVACVGDLYILELWHGPTLAFKDVALQLLGRLFEHILAGREGPDAELNILAATSGDTGSAAIHGVRGRRGLRIFVMHPHGRVSPIQQRQMTTVLDDNVHNIAVEGSFDDCQRIMKELAGDINFKRRYRIGAVNSVNWARVLAQVVYYFKAALEVRGRTRSAEVDVAVPTGNFGDILAGWYARRMGAPIGRLILATNRNDILSRFFRTGEYVAGEVSATLSPAMDIQVASNFERYLFYRVGGDASRLRELMGQFARTGRLEVETEPDGSVDPLFAAGAAGEEETLATIGRWHQRHGYLLDPHTAVGVTVAERLAEEDGGPARPTICLATAHPAKFPDAIERATGADLAHHPIIDALADLPTRQEVLPDDPAAVRDFIVRTVG
jgi:threonine synthase